LLAYYKQVVPNSFADGDLQNARYLVWKYRGKKAALWKRLEKKYGVPVREEWEWDTDAESQSEESEEENLDENDNDKAKKDQPDL
jgi:hypothetical protein